MLLHIREYLIFKKILMAKSPKSCFESSAVSNLLGNVKLWLKRKNRHNVDVGFPVNVKLSEKVKWPTKVDVDN